MKRTVIGIVIGMALTGLIAMKAQNKKNYAEVDQLQGIYIFSDSKPVNEYEYLGTVKSGGGLSGGQYSDVRDRIIKKTKAEYPQAEGIILNLKAGGIDKADVIKFK